MLHPQRDGEACLPTHEVTQLLQGITAGDQEALTTFYDRTSALVYSLALRMLREPVAAQDITLEVYAQVWRQASQYAPHRGTPIAWLYAMTRSRALDRLRTGARLHQREQPLELVLQVPDTQPGPAESSVTHEEQRLVQEALQSLLPEQREVIELVYFAGLSHRDIAAHLAQPLGPVKTRIRLGMLRLRERLSSALGG